MSAKPTTPYSRFVQSIRKFLLSAFVIFTFVAYLIHERHTTPANASLSPSAPTTGIVPTVASDPTASDTPVDSAASTAANTATVPPIAPPTLQPPSVGPYKNGTFAGPQVNAYYGLVQVQVVIQNGQITDVQFLDYPHDRRTSQMINSQAMPWLTQEVIQAQNANVNIISGATLTSEAFVTSLQSALQSAQN